MSTKVLKQDDDVARRASQADPESRRASPASLEARRASQATPEARRSSQAHRASQADSEARRASQADLEARRASQADLEARRESQADPDSSTSTTPSMKPKMLRTVKFENSAPPRASTGETVVAETIKVISDEDALQEDEDQFPEFDEVTPTEDDHLVEPIATLRQREQRFETGGVRASTAAAAAFNDNPKAVETCVKLLKVIIERYSKPILTNSPMKQFGFEQVYLGAVEILQKIDSEILTHIDVKEIIANLANFSANKCVGDNQNVRVHFAQAMVSLMIAVAELANCLEKLSGLAPVDWVANSKIIQPKKTANPVPAPSTSTDVVIPIAELKSHRLIGTGTYGNVYKVRYKDLWFGMKIVPFSKFPARYQSQSYLDKAVQAIAFDFVIGKMFCTFVAKPNCYIMLMDLSQKYPRYDLERAIKVAGYFNSNSVTFIVFQLVCALEHLHLNGFMHRDVCLSNILIDARGHTRLIDFDGGRVCRGHFSLADMSRTYFRRTAIEFDDKPKSSSQTYTAPEILKGFSYGRASDWWAVGVVTYKCATGRAPFRAKEPADLKQNILTKKYFWPANNRHSATKETREFVYDLLKKKPTARLGSRSYADIHNHSFMDQCAKRITATDGVQLTRKDAISLKQKLHATNFLVDFNSILRAIPSAGNTRESSIRFEDLEDEDQSAQQPLYTYATTKCRKLFDRLEKKLNRRALNHVVAAFMTSKTPPQEHFDVSRCGAADFDRETTENKSRSDTHMQRLAFNERTSVNLPVKYHRILCCRRVSAVDFEMVVGDGGLFYPAVTWVPENMLPNAVVVGDLIASIGGERTGDLTLCNIRNIIHRASGAHRSRSIVVEVMARNIFRRITEAPLEVGTFVTVVPRAVVTVPLFRNRHKAIQTVEIVLEGYGPLYIVSHVEPSSRHRIQGNIFFGDVILEVNGLDVKKVSQLNFKEVFELKKSVVLRIAETSVLRRSDLRDAVLEGI